MYPLEHFYYGQLVHRGQPSGELRVLAKSAGISDDMVAACVRSALIPPMPESPDGSWALLRVGRGLPMFFVQAQMGSAGQMMLHYFAIPLDFARLLAGDTAALQSLVRNQMPTYDQLGEPLIPVTLTASLPRSMDAQVDELLNLMTYTKNKTRNIQVMLSTIVQGRTLIITGAPSDTEMRAGLIAGLITLLPSSTRYGVTFATHIDRQSRAKPQIVFGDIPLTEDAIGYDWRSGTLSSSDISDEYSKFIVSQLRLDAEMALQQAEALTPVAGWRVQMGSPLAEALAYASHRLSLDGAVMQHQPVQMAEVARVLREDPTLDTELRAAYARHLMSFSLALEDLAHIDPVGPVLSQQPELGVEVHQMLKQAANDGKGAMVHRILTRWLADPLSPQGPDWVKLAHQAAADDVRHLVRTKDVDGLIEALEALYHMDSTMLPETIAPSIIRSALPLASHPYIAAQLFVFGLRHLPAAQLGGLASSGLTQQLPDQVQQLISGQSRNMAAAIDALSHYCKREDVLLSLARLAAETDRVHLFNDPIIDELTEVAETSSQLDIRSTIIAIAEHLHNGDNLDQLSRESATRLLRMLLASGAYTSLAKALRQQWYTLYRGEAQFDYLRLLQGLFNQASFTAEQARSLMAALAGSGISGIPLAAARCGILAGAKWNPELQPEARAALDELEKQPGFESVIQPEIMLALIYYFSSSGALDDARRAASWMPLVCTHQSPGASLKLIVESYRQLQNQPELRRTAFDMLRDYVRIADDSAARRLMQHANSQFGAAIARRLQMAYVMRQLMGGADVNAYRRRLSMAVTFLSRSVEAFDPRSKPVSLESLVLSVGRLEAGIGAEQRTALGTRLRRAGQMSILLGRTSNERNKAPIAELMAGRAKAQNGLDILRISAVCWGLPPDQKISITPTQQADPFHGIRPQDVAEMIAATYQVLAGLNAAFPTDRAIPWTARDLQAELQDLRRGAGISKADTLETALHWRTLAELLPAVARIGDATVLDPNHRQGQRLDLRREAPRNVIALWRFIYGQWGT